LSGGYEGSSKYEILSIGGFEIREEKERRERFRTESFSGTGTGFLNPKPSKTLK
jgi:hypothetical protein